MGNGVTGILCLLMTTPNKKKNLNGPGEASLDILTSISVTACAAVFHSKCKE